MSSNRKNKKDGKNEKGTSYIRRSNYSLAFCRQTLKKTQKEPTARQNLVRKIYKKTIKTARLANINTLSKRARIRAILT